MKNYANWLDLKSTCRYVFPSANRTAGRRLPWHVAASLRYALSWPPKSVRRWNGGNGRPPLLQDWPGGGRLSCYWRQGPPNLRWRRPSACNAPWSATGPSGFSPSVWTVFQTPLAAAPRAVFPPEVAIHVVRLACERPDLLGRSLSPWDCHELARQLIAEGIVEDISASTVRRILAAPQLKPWRHHLWLHPKHPRDAAFCATIADLIDLSTRPRRADEIVLSVDEKTSLQPRPRLSPTLPAPPHHRPNHVEHEDKRAGALNLFAAVDPRAGKVYGPCADRKRQRACIALLDAVDGEVDEPICTIHLVCDHVSTHHGQEVSMWFAPHPRVVVHFTPVHGSWMNHVEPWFSILQRTRLRMVDFASKDHLRAKLDQFIQEWSQQAHPFHWSTKSVAKIMAAAPALAA
jgi:hypothetical protein